MSKFATTEKRPPLVNPYKQKTPAQLRAIPPRKKPERVRDDIFDDDGPAPAAADLKELNAYETAQMFREKQTLENALNAKRARGSLLEFIKYTMPDPEHEEDTSRSLYKNAHFHTLICEAVERVERGDLQLLILTMPPRHGKTEICSKRLSAYFSARNPTRHVAVATYSDEFAESIGEEVRTNMHSPRFKALFPTYEFARGSRSKDFQKNTQGGSLRFVGRGGSFTGRGAHLIIIDDLMKDAVEANSVAIRDQAWEWFTKVAMTRRMGHKAVIIIMCMTGDTDVLLADGSTRKLRDIRAGDTVATYEDGRLHGSVILNHASQGVDRVFEITTASGVKVKANERHPFLVDRGGTTEWVKLRDLKVGDVVLTANRAVRGQASSVATRAASGLSAVEGSARPTTTKTAGRAVGGCHPSTPPRVEKLASNTVTGSPNSITTSSSSCRTGSAPSAGSTPRKGTPAPIGTGSSASTTATTQERSAACSATTATLQSDTAKPKKFSSPPLDTFAVTRDAIVSIEPAGEEEVFDVQVAETENFIANGLVSHNTRWHEDDIVGRLIDPNNHRFNKDMSKKWKIINLPAIAEMDDPLGRPVGAPLWPDGPDKFDLEFLKEQQSLDPFGFAALYQQRPSVEDGELFRRENIRFYKPEDLPKDLTIYGASDIAVGKDAKKHDASVLLTVGVDRQNHIWLLDCVWDRMASDVTVERFLSMQQARQPLMWWAERGVISLSIGPFLYKRMQESGTYLNIVEITPSANKEQRAQSIAGRVAMGMVHFPEDQTWATKGVDQMLKFPHGTNDDFVDTLAYIGLGLGNQFGPAKTRSAFQPREGSFGALMGELKRRERENARVRW